MEIRRAAAVVGTSAVVLSCNFLFPSLHLPVRGSSFNDSPAARVFKSFLLISNNPSGYSACVGVLSPGSIVPSDEL